MTLLFFDGWETGDISQWDGSYILGTGSLSVQSGVKKTGTYALEAHSGTRRAVVYKTVSATKRGYFTIQVRPESGFGIVENHGASFAYVCSEYDPIYGNLTRAYMSVIRSGGVYKWRFGWHTSLTGLVTEIGEQITLQQWYSIKIMFKIAVNGYYKFYIDGVLKKEVYADTTITDKPDLGIGYIEVGSTNTRNNISGDDRVFYLDDVYIYTTENEGEDNDSWIIDVSGTTVLIFDRILDVSMEQSSDVALRDVPLKTTGEVMDTGTYLLHTLTLEFTTRLSDSEKITIETLYNGRIELIIHLQLWAFTGWLRKPDIVYEFETNRPWKATLTFDIYTYTYSGSSVGTFSNQQLRLVGSLATLDYINIIGFVKSEETSVAIPKWVNQNPTIDTNIWNKTLKRMTYIVRETEYRLYQLLQMLTAHTAITLTDYIHGPTNKTAWLSYVRAEWNPLKKEDVVSSSFIDTPWEVEFEVIVQE